MRGTAENFSVEVEEFHFVFKVRLFFEISDEDLAAVEMMYIQATHDVVDARYPCSEQDSITLAALQVAVKRLKYQHLNEELMAKFTHELMILSRVRRHRIANPSPSRRLPQP